LERSDVLAFCTAQFAAALHAHTCADVAMSPSNAPAEVFLSLDAVIIAVTEGCPRVLTVPRDALPALPSGWLENERHPTLERAVRDWVQRLGGIALGYVEQLYTFGDRLRDPRERQSLGRVVSAAYLALLREPERDVSGRWLDIYSVLPWEDWRNGQPALLREPMFDALARWAGSDVQRRERVDLCFGLGGAAFDPERCLERYELLWSAGLVDEARAGSDTGADGGMPHFGLAMALDHRRMLATALGRLRGKIRYRPVVFELLAAEFTLSQLQRTVEALAGNLLHTQNFRRLVEQGGLVEGTGRRSLTTGGRPAELFRFRHEVLRERPAPGVHFPGAWRI
jgi:hypothetical protein